MAKKLLTPEETQANIDRKVAKRKIFFGTFTKSLAFFLAIAMCYSLTVIAFTKPQAPVAAPAGSQSTAPSKPEDDPFANGNNSQTPSAPTEGETPATPAEGEKPADGAATLSKADAIKFLNEQTALAAKGNYKMARDAEFTKSIQVGGEKFTNVLNGIIKPIVQGDDWDGNDDWGVNEVVGDFIGVVPKSKDPIRGIVTAGKLAEKGSEGTTTSNENYLIKGMTLTDADVTKFKADGTTYIFQIGNSNTPQRDNKTPLSHATNDFLTQDEVQAALQSAAGGAIGFDTKKTSTVDYTNIIVKATTDGKKITQLEISYDFAADLNLKAAIVGIHGTGAAKAKTVYTEIAY